MRKLWFSKVKLKLTQQESGKQGIHMYVPSPALDRCAVLGPAASPGPAARGRLAEAR